MQSVAIAPWPEVTLEPNRRPYLYGLVSDDQAKSIRTRDQADKFAAYLRAKRLRLSVAGQALAVEHIEHDKR